jgi:hypothetical protein
MKKKVIVVTDSLQSQKETCRLKNVNRIHTQKKSSASNGLQETWLFLACGNKLHYE